MSQCTDVLKYMELHGSITCRQADRQLGCMRLPARIHDLKQRGYKIKKEMITVRTRHGKTEVARYSLE